jgi:hypothetical protein
MRPFALAPSIRLAVEPANADPSPRCLPRQTDAEAAELVELVELLELLELLELVELVELLELLELVELVEPLASDADPVAAEALAATGAGSAVATTADALLGAAASPGAAPEPASSTLAAGALTEAV